MDLKEVFKANDIRGIYGEILDDNLAFKVGKAVVKFLKCKNIFVGRDMRLSSPRLFSSLARGVIESGADVIDIGMIDTPSLYFMTGRYKKPGIMITASHNPAEYNGIKILDSGAKPVDSQNGFDEIEKIIEKENFFKSYKSGVIIKKDIFKEYKKYVLSFADSRKIMNVKVVIDAGNGMAGKIIPFIYRGLDLKIIPLYFRLDGRFPNHVPNPIIKKNIGTLQKNVRNKRADFGMAFDGDMDRVTFVDERGRFVNTSHLGALLTKYFLKKSREKGKSPIIYSSATSRIIKEVISKYGGISLREKVGHAYIKRRMRKTNALFGMEHSGHYYYKDNYHADSGLITSLIILDIYSEAKKIEMKFSDLIKEFNVYSQADEVSIVLNDNEDVLSRIEKYYRAKKPKKIDHFDGLWIEFNDYWFSVRKSNTEPLLRVNLEAVNKKIMKEKLKEVLGIVKR